MDSKTDPNKLQTIEKDILLHIQEYLIKIITFHIAVRCKTKLFKQLLFCSVIRIQFERHAQWVENWHDPRWPAKKLSIP